MPPGRPCHGHYFRLNSFPVALAKRTTVKSNSILGWLTIVFWILQRPVSGFASAVLGFSGPFNDTRDVAFTRPSILLPQSIYPDVTRALSLSADGATFYGEYRSSWGDFTLETVLGLPRVTDSETEFALLSEDFPGDVEPRLSYFGRLVYELDQGDCGWP